MALVGDIVGVNCDVPLSVAMVVAPVTVIPVTGTTWLLIVIVSCP